MLYRLFMCKILLSTGLDLENFSIYENLDSRVLRSMHAKPVL